MGGRADGDAGESLVDVHAEVLLAVTAEPDRVVVAEDSVDAIDEPRWVISSLRRMQSQPTTSCGSPISARIVGKGLFQVPDKIQAAAPRRTMPSSMAQKNVRLPSGLAFWIERT